ncbi:MAG TPA: signal peptidase II [Chloroflexota bacterium]|nr:signal peptidase II [Chloroflexota bacterium]
MRLLPRLLLVVLLVLTGVGCDQATKRIASDELRTAVPRSYAGDTFRLLYSQNPGSVLGLGGGLPEELRFAVFVVGVGALLFGLLFFVLFSRAPAPNTVVGVGLILGGGLSNWADRVLNGNLVVDFMNVGVGPLRSGVFNVADLLIELGALVLLVGAWRASRDRPEEAEA